MGVGSPQRHDKRRQTDRPTFCRGPNRETPGQAGPGRPSYPRAHRAPKEVTIFHGQDPLPVELG